MHLVVALTVVGVVLLVVHLRARTAAADSGGRVRQGATASRSNRLRGRECAELGQERWLRRNGWRGDKDTRTGLFRTSFGNFTGRIELRDDGFWVFIRHPPEWLLEGWKSECIHYVGGGFYRVHLNQSPENFVRAVCAVEHFLFKKKAKSRRAG